MNEKELVLLVTKGGKKKTKKRIKLPLAALSL